MSPAFSHSLAAAAAAAAAVLCLLVFAPSGALAADFCVANSSCEAAGGTHEISVEAALAAANADSAPDRVLIGPGTFTAPSVFGYVSGGNPVQIIGSGAGSTTLTGPQGTDRVLFVGNPSSVVSDLRVDLPEDNSVFTKVGLRMESGTARRIAVSADPSITPVVIGVVMDSGVLEDSTIQLGSKVPAVTTAVQTNGASTIRDNVLSGKNGISVQGPDVHLQRDNVTAVTGNGIDVVDSASNIDASDSLIQVVGKGTGVLADTGNGTDAGISALGLTIVGDGTLGSSGVMASSNTAHSAFVNLNSSIVRGVDHSLLIGQSAGSAAVDASFSDFDSSTVKKLFGTGTFTNGPGNINTDPQFAGGQDFHLLSGSPAIDTGDPAATSDASDLDGKDRVADGRGTGVARRDMGAFEAPAVPAVAPPSAGTSSGASSQPGSPATLTIDGLNVSPSRFAVAGGSKTRHSRTAHGTRFRFNLSQAADVRIVIQRRLAGHRARFRKVGSLKRHAAAGADSIRFSGRLGGKVLQPGHYRALVSAVDAAGHRTSAQRAAFTIVRG
jgi:hypothetical protein